MSEVISQSVLDSIIGDSQTPGTFGSCMFELSGFSISGSEEPGISSLIKVFIRIIEAGMIVSFDPLVKMTQMIKDVTTLPDQIAQFIEDLKEIINNPAAFIIEQLLDPIVKHMTIPIPSLQVFIDILVGGKTLSDVVWTDISNLLLPEGFLKLSDDIKDGILKTIESGKEFMSKLFNFLMIPIKVMIGFFESFIQLVIQALDITKIIDFVTSWSNPVNQTLIMISDIFANVLIVIINDLYTDIAIPADNIKELLTGIFSSSLTRDDIKAFYDKFLPLKYIEGFMNTIICLIEWIINFISQIPTLILG